MVLDADHAHAVVARCLTDCAYLGDALAAHTSLVDKHEASSFLGRELDKIALFQGFITKVKHNRLRSVLPCTFQLLASLGEELPFFVDYSPAYAVLRSAGPVSLDAQCEDLSRHLQAYVEDRSVQHGRLVLSVNAHELVTRQLARLDVEAVPVDLVAEDVTDDPDAVRWDGRLIVRRYDADVLATCAAIQARKLDLEADALRQVAIVAYWRGANDQSVKAFNVDQATSLMLSLVDGRRSYGRISATFNAAVGADTDPDDVRRFFREAEAYGMRVRAAPPI